MSYYDAQGILHLSESAYDDLLPYGNRRTARNDILHPRSNHANPESQFVERYIQMPLHFDQHNPATWPAEYAMHRSAHKSSQQPPNPNHAPHGGREVIPPRGEESSTSASHHSPAKQQSTNARGPQGVRKAMVKKGSPMTWLLSLGYIIVPQNIFVVGPAGGPTIPPIDFEPRSNESYLELGIDKDTARATHSILNSKDKVFSHVPGIDTILIKILWPGYPNHPFEGIIYNARNLKRGELLDLVCKAVSEFVRGLKATPNKVVKEYAEWKIGVGQSRGLKMHKFYVSRLYHLGGNHFQPEIWAYHFRKDES